MLRIIATLPLAAVALLTLVFWWHYPHLTEMQVFQAQWPSLLAGALLSVAAYMALWMAERNHDR